MTEYTSRGMTRDRGRMSGVAPWCAKLTSQIVFCCLLVLIVVTAIPYGTVEPWWETVFECSVFALVALWIIEVLFRGSWQLESLTILLPLLVITAYAFAQTFEWPAAWLVFGRGR